MIIVNVCWIPQRPHPDTVRVGVRVQSSQQHFAQEFSEDDGERAAI